MGVEREHALLTYDNTNFKEEYNLQFLTQRFNNRTNIHTNNSISNLLQYTLFLE